jgi:hypothetical protein
VREPPPPLALVHAERLEAALEIVRENSRTPLLVVEREHPDTARLAVAAQREPCRSGLGSRLPQRADDRVELAHPPVPEEGERDVQVLRRNGPDAGHRAERVRLPRDEPLHRLRREPQRAEEPHPFIALDASKSIHTKPS